MKKKTHGSDAFSIAFKAAHKYYPLEICHALKRDVNGTVYADKSLLVHTEEEEQDFMLALDFLYRLGYKKNRREATIFLKVNGDTILGGVYYPKTKEHGKSFVVAYRNSIFGTTAYNKYWWYPAPYADEVFDQVCAKVKEA